MKRKPKYGEVYYVKPSRQVTGSEQRAGRPAIVVSNDVGNDCSDIVEVVYLTTKEKASLPTHVDIPAAGRLAQSVALCEQINTVSQQRLTDRVGVLDAATMTRVQGAMMVSLNVVEDPNMVSTIAELRMKVFLLEASVEAYKTMHAQLVRELRSEPAYVAMNNMEHINFGGNV